MMKNNPNDVTSLLTELMQRISDEDLTDEKLVMEIDRGKAVADISKNVLAIWNMQVRIAESQDAALRPELFNLPAALKA
jgi:hypothetical protein